MAQVVDATQCSAFRAHPADTPASHRLRCVSRPYAAAVDNLSDLAARATMFASERNLTLLPAVPERDFGPEVSFDPARTDLDTFLGFAAQLCGGVLYLRADPFDPAQAAELGEQAAGLRRRKGKVGHVQAAFAANGLVHFWEQRTAWYEEFEELRDAQNRGVRDRAYLADDDDLDGRPDAETRAKMAGELAEKLLAMPEFRAAKGGARQRIARLNVPADQDWLIWDGVRAATDKAEAMASEIYAQLGQRLDDLAPDLAAYPAYRSATSAAGRKQATEQFLAEHADGFSPPALIRDELHGRAQKVAKQPGFF